MATEADGPRKPTLGVPHHADTGADTTHSDRDSADAANCLYGSLSPLPVAYTRQCMQWAAQQIGTPLQFLQVLQRILQRLLVDVVNRNRVGSASTRVQSPLATALRRLIQAAVPVDESALLTQETVIRCLPLWLSGRRGVAGLHTLLTAVIPDCRIRIQPRVAHTVPIDTRDRVALGCRHALGSSAIIGRSLREHTNRFRVVLGPVNHLHLATVVSGTAPGGVIETWIRRYVAQPLECELVIYAGRDATNPIQLGTANPYRLGRDTWMLEAQGAAHRHLRRIVTT